jgi:cyclase
MLRPRVIPTLLLADDGLVKTRRFKDPAYVGDPVNAIRIFNDKEVDELVLLDIAASRTGRGPNLQLIEEVASECFMPLAYGGGIRTVEDMRGLLRIGVEKVIINSAERSC